MLSILLAVGAGIAITVVMQRIIRFLQKRKISFFSDPEEWKQVSLTKKEQVSHNSLIYHFSFPSTSHILDLAVGRHVKLRFQNNQETISRSYTPLPEEDGHSGAFRLLVKTYPQGKMSQHLFNLPLNSTIDIRGPKGRFEYRPSTVDSYLMLAGGTGITPIWQVIWELGRKGRSNFSPTVSLLYANVSAEDILLRDEIESLAEESNGTFSVHHVLNSLSGAKGGSSFSEGFITEDLIKKFVASGERTQVLICGPPPMVKAMQAICSANAYSHFTF